MKIRKQFQVSGNSPASATQAIVGTALPGLLKYDEFSFAVSVGSPTGGTLDVYIQRKLDTNVWSDWAHFPQRTAAAAAIWYALNPASAAAITAVGETADDGVTGAPALAVNTCVGGHPGDQIRILAVGGVGTSAGTAIKLYLDCFASI